MRFRPLQQLLYPWFITLTVLKTQILSVQTKPGVIRPMTAIPTLTVEDEEEYCRNPFRQFVSKKTFTDNKKVPLWHVFRPAYLKFQ